MTVLIQIHYKADARVSQAASFHLKGRKPEQVAFLWWKQIKKEMSYLVELEKVIADNQDITQLVIDLEKLEWKTAEDNWDLPF